MAVECKTWIEKVKKVGETPSWTIMANKLDRLGFSEDKARGKVLVIGPDEDFPERLPLTTFESSYRTLREEIEFLLVCDNNPKLFDKFHSIHPTWLNCHPLVVFSSGDYPIPNYDNNMSYRFIPSDVRSLLIRCDGVLLDLVTIFCISHIGYELKYGLGGLIANHLCPGGYVMGSGIFPENTNPCLPGLKIEVLAELGRPTGAKHNCEVNLAFLARKPD